jgi:hypothetical protein
MSLYEAYLLESHFLVSLVNHTLCNVFMFLSDDDFNLTWHYFRTGLMADV